MKLTVNGEAQEFPEGGNLQELLESLGKSQQRGIAVAVNGSVVTSSHWAEYALSDGDEVLIIQATQGG